MFGLGKKRTQEQKKQKEEAKLKQQQQQQQIKPVATATKPQVKQAPQPPVQRIPQNPFVKIALGLDNPEEQNKVVDLTAKNMPEVFADVPLSISDYDYIDLRGELLKTFEQVKELNNALLRIHMSAQNMANVNQNLGAQMSKVYTQGHKSHTEAVIITETHTQTKNAFNELMKKQSIEFELLKTWFDKFNVLQVKIKNRDKAQENFKHYYERVNQLKREIQVKKDTLPSYSESDKSIKEAQALAIAEAKYEGALKEFEIINTSTYNEMGNLIKNKLQVLTPIVSKFISATTRFYMQAGNTFAEMKDKMVAYGIDQPEDSLEKQMIIPDKAIQAHHIALADEFEKRDKAAAAAAAASMSGQKQQKPHEEDLVFQFKQINQASHQASNDKKNQIKVQKEQEKQAQLHPQPIVQKAPVPEVNKVNYADAFINKYSQYFQDEDQDAAWVQQQQHQQNDQSYQQMNQQPLDYNYQQDGNQYANHQQQQQESWGQQQQQYQAPSVIPQEQHNYSQPINKSIPYQQQQQHYSSTNSSVYSKPQQNQQNWNTQSNMGNGYANNGGIQKQNTYKAPVQLQQSYQQQPVHTPQKLQQNIVPQKSPQSSQFFGSQWDQSKVASNSNINTTSNQKVTSSAKQNDFDFESFGWGTAPEPKQQFKPDPHYTNLQGFGNSPLKTQSNTNANSGFTNAFNDLSIFDTMNTPAVAPLQQQQQQPTANRVKGKKNPFAL